jgi:hypothetical protein
MTALREPLRPARPTGTRRAWNGLLRRASQPEGRIIGGLVIGTLLIAALIDRFDVVPLSALVVPLLVGSLLLGPRQLPWFVVYVLVVLMLLLTSRSQLDSRTVGAVTILFLLSFIILLTSFRRSRLGVAGALGESMLVDLRDRILSQGGIPQLPAGWNAESALRSAGGTPFAGDFVVAAKSRAGDRLDVVVVDVSGKGEQAGTRALLLSGACGGLLTSLPSADFLRASNDYLLRQEWEEGFATAVHLSLDLGSGAFQLRSAGHPPAVHFAAGAGRWSVLAVDGPVLGLIEDAEFPVVEGVLRPGDALLLYTDGMVETPRRDISLGIDRLLGQAERLLRGGFDGGAARLVDAVGSDNDDRALLLVHRR